MLTNRIKAFSLVMILFFFSSTAWSDNGRFSFGPTLTIGTGRTNSNALGEVMDRRNALDRDIKESDKSSLPGFSFAAGGQFIWHISDRFEADISANFSYLANTIVLEQMEDDSHQDLTSRETIESEALIKTSSIQLPISFRYRLPTSSKAWFLRAGTAIDILMDSSIESEEKIIEEEWENGTRLSISEVYKKHVADIDNINSTQFSFLLGGGRRFPLGRNTLEIALEIIIPLTKTELYTTDLTFTNGTELNELYSLRGNIDAMRDTGIRLDDFGYGSIQLTAAYLFEIRNSK